MSAEVLASVIAGEAGICSPMAWLAVAWVYQRNREFYARETPVDAMLFVAQAWRIFPDPTLGAHTLNMRIDIPS